MRTVDLLLHGASQVVTLDGGSGPKAGSTAMNDLGVIENGAVAIARGRIVAVGATRDIEARFTARRRIRCRGRTLLPGLVDAHTHPVFARMRENEFALRCRGADYEEILEQGGGIHASAAALQDVPRADLARDVARRFDRMLLHGTTTVEAKSGYGLTTESEIKSLEALRLADRDHPITVVPTFLGAHAMPPRFAKNRKAYVREVVEEMIPRVARRKLARFCDVFVEEGAFTIPEGRKILEAGKAYGLDPKVHADQFRDGGGAGLAARVGAVSAEHLEGTGPKGIRALARAGVIPVLLPSVSLFLGLERANARAMIEAGCAVALATDFNPGSSPTENLHLVAALACSTLGMTPEETIAAITRNAAAAIGMEDTRGRIAPGRRADVLVLDAPSYVMLPYRLGTNLTHTVIAGGDVVVERGRRVGTRRR